MCGESRGVVTIDNDGDTDNIIVKLAAMRADFELDGYRYCAAPPVVDPIARRIVYTCEGWEIE